MHIHESVFWGIVFFLMGVFIAPAASLAAVAVATGIIAVAGSLVGYRKRNKRIVWIAMLALLAAVGAMYWTGYNTYQKNKVASVVGRNGAITGHVVAARRSEKSQQLIVKMDAQGGGTISATARAYPLLRYGDVIAIKGAIKRPDEKNGSYLMKDGIFATAQFPEVQLIKQHDGNPVLTKLLAIRQQAVAVYKRALPTEEAALLAGITLGERAEFDAEFKASMANSGTTHLVALSGYNISVVAEAILLLCGFVMRRTAAFYATLMAVIGFVIMAGAEASVVRAAIMGSIVLLAGYIGRAHSMRNAIAISAAAMVLWNPNVLRYDLGFQLSFLALIGIVYCKPYLDRVIKRKKNGFLDWRENLSGTLSAQLMVFPVLMNAVGSFSLISLLSNIVILAFIPVTMGLGFVIAGLGFIVEPLAMIPAWIASLLLKYEIGMINLFGAHKGFTLPMNGAWVMVYYMLAAGVLLYIRSCKTQVERPYEN